VSDEPFYAPFKKPPPPRQPSPGELLWTLREGHRTESAELRTHAEAGVELQLLMDGELVLGQRYLTRPRGRGSGDVSIAPRGRRLDNRMSDDLFYRPNMSDVEHRAWDGRSRSLMALSVFLPFRFSPLHRKCPGVELPGNHQFVVYEDSCLDSRVTILQLAFVFGYLGLLLRVFTCRSTRCAGNARFGLWSEAATQTTQIGERDVGTVVAAGFFVESDVRFRCQVLAC
jgi:hypothetical protein